MSISLNPPEGVDYTMFSGTSGCATKIWGPKGWDFLFTSIMGSFPVNVQTNEDKLISLYFKRTIHALMYTMPCIFCKISFKKFYKELPIEEYMSSRINLMYWLYLIKDKVNRKLLKQEKKCLNDEKLRLKSLYKKGEINKSEYYNSITDFKENAFKTVPTPPFEEILNKYEGSRAVCSAKSLSCVLPKDTAKSVEKSQELSWKN
jgi:hypothetical protein